MTAVREPDDTLDTSCLIRASTEDNRWTGPPRSAAQATYRPGWPTATSKPVHEKNLQKGTVGVCPRRGGGCMCSGERQRPLTTCRSQHPCRRRNARQAISSLACRLPNQRGRVEGLEGEERGGEDGGQAALPPPLPRAPRHRHQRQGITALLCASRGCLGASIPTFA